MKTKLLLALLLMTAGFGHCQVPGVFSTVSTTCVMHDPTDICLASPPYNASGNGVTTTTTSTATTPGTSVHVASCSTFTVGNGVLIHGAGVSAANYLGAVISCFGTNMIVSPATATSVSSGVVVQHDETAALIAAVNHLASLPTASGTIWFPDGTYLMNGPLQDTSGANAVVPMPKIPNYTSTLAKIAIRGYTDPNTGTVGGANIQTSALTGNFIGGFDSDTGGGSPPFTNVELTLLDISLFAPGNPGITMVDAEHLQALTLQNVVISTFNIQTFSNTNGVGVLYPGILNTVQNHMDNVTIAGYYSNVFLTEHTQVGTLYSQWSNNCAVFDNRLNATKPALYQGNSVSVDYLWTFNCVNAIVSGEAPTVINIQNADVELTTNNVIQDPGNLLYGIANVHNPYSPHNITISGGANLSTRNLWTQGGVTIGGPVTPGYGSAVVYNEQGVTGVPNIFLTNVAIHTLSIDSVSPGDHAGTLIAGTLESATAQVSGIAQVGSGSTVNGSPMCTPANSACVATPLTCNANGCYRIEIDGTIYQKGTQFCSGTSCTVTFPITFTSATSYAVTSNIETTQNNIATNIFGKSASGFTYSNAAFAQPGGAGNTYTGGSTQDWIAIGN